jgi:hypothetical protein
MATLTVHVPETSDLVSYLTEVLEALENGESSGWVDKYQNWDTE